MQDSLCESLRARGFLRVRDSFFALQAAPDHVRDVRLHLTSEICVYRCEAGLRSKKILRLRVVNASRVTIPY